MVNILWFLAMKWKRFVCNVTKFVVIFSSLCRSFEAHIASMCMSHCTFKHTHTHTHTSTNVTLYNVHSHTHCSFAFYNLATLARFTSSIVYFLHGFCRAIYLYSGSTGVQKSRLTTKMMLKTTMVKLFFSTLRSITSASNGRHYNVNKDAICRMYTLYYGKGIGMRGSPIITHTAFERWVHV